MRASALHSIWSGVAASGPVGTGTLRRMSVQPSATMSSGSSMPDMMLLKLSDRARCHPGVSDFAHAASVGRLSRGSIEEGVRWKTVRCFAALARCGMAWTAVEPVPTIATDLSRRAAMGSPGAPPV